MAHSTVQQNVLAEAFGPSEGSALRVKQIVLVMLGIVALTIAAKIRVPMWPVSITMQTFAVLTIGAAYGLRLGVITILGYLAVGFGFAAFAQVTTGTAGWTVFTGTSADLAYFAGPTAGYLLGFVIAAAVVGELARRGWSQTFGGMAASLLIGNGVIYAIGLPWMAYLFLAEKGGVWVMQWGMTNFLLGDLLKLILAAIIVPAVWKLVGDARR